MKPASFSRAYFATFASSEPEMTVRFRSKVKESRCLSPIGSSALTLYTDLWLVRSRLPPCWLLPRLADFEGHVPLAGEPHSSVFVSESDLP